jgi:two-component system, NarL family, nitrate/nitrite response regulator NarL
MNQSTMPNAIQPIKLLVVDDHPLFRRGLTALLSQDERFKVVAQASDMGEALRALPIHIPDLVLLDNNLPGVRGIDGIAAIKGICPEARILMLTVSENSEDLSAALHAGANGYLLKTVESEHLCEAIMKVFAGESVVSPEMLSKLVAAFKANVDMVGSGSRVEKLISDPTSVPALDGISLLSTREREVLALIARGDSNKLIARALNIAEATVKIHVQHILRKLNLTSRVQAAVYAAALDGS